ncbi:translesion error-prone DNA polymerase V autoproteolytic subunit [Chlorobium sp. N1]|uniref:LexA family protein n=1 Tax=Chlorobium sp. N1 TaxID=2491138 RepID=UPI00103CB2BA|nr:translesion error-prone DNA polymerase V autoproteolytic subunit [Chlorobium sp. N1]TCD47161.1 translesion error-prone DNA polymerase V autoproteolytic subunit [Chlorobium sp. N1]
MRLTPIHDTPSLEFYAADLSTPLELPLAATAVSAGFPSPAEDHLELTLDLNRALVRHPDATFYARVKGSSMIDAGISEGDILVIDRSLEPKDGDIALCFLDGEFTVKRIARRDGALFLMPENSAFSPIRISEESDFQVWGIVTYVIHRSR